MYRTLGSMLSLHMREYVAVITIVGPLLNPDLSDLVVRDRSVTDDGEYRDVAL